MLTEEQLKIIRNEYADGRSIREIAQYMGIPKSTIGDVISGKTYKSETCKQGVIGKSLSEIFREEASKIITDGWNKIHPEQSSTSGYISPFTEVNDWDDTNTPILNKDTHMDGVLPKDWNKIEIDGEKIDFSVVSPEKIAEELRVEKKDSYGACYADSNKHQTWGERVFYPGPVEKTDKRVLIVSDFHSGSVSGLCHPSWYVNKDGSSKDYAIQKECWEWYESTIKDIGKVDCVICNGDLIDGTGKRSGGTENITNDLFDQAKNAIKCLEIIDTNKYFLSYGTPYHCSDIDGNDFEKYIAEHFNAPISDHLYLNVNGCVLDCKHKIGSSSTISSRVSNLIKEYSWGKEWHDKYSYPMGDIFIRSHCHYSMVVQDSGNFIGLTTPSLQAPNTKFGGRQCVGTVDFGFVLLTIPGNYKSVDDVTVKVFKKKLVSSKGKEFIL